MFLERPEAWRLAVAVAFGVILDAPPEIEVELGCRDHSVTARSARSPAREEIGFALERA